MNLEQIVELQKNRMGVYGMNNQDDLINTTFDDFEENPAYKIVTHKSEEIGVHFIHKSGQNRHKEMIIISKPSNEINVGDYITDSDEINWLCYGLDTHPIRKNYVDKTNHNLKWINSNNKLITKPCIWSTKTLYTTGIKEEKLITVPDGMVGIQLPYDEDTKKLKRGDEFVFNDNKYKTTFLNRVEYKGLLILMCDESAFNPSIDDMTNEIANRYTTDGKDRLDDLEPEEPDPSGGTTYTIEGSDTLKVYDAQLYIAKKFIDGVQDTTAKFTFTVSDETMAEIWEVTDTTLDLEGKNKNVGQFFTITATDVESGQTTTKQVQLINNY